MLFAMGICIFWAYSLRMLFAVLRCFPCCLYFVDVKKGEIEKYIFLSLEFSVSRESDEGSQNGRSN